MATPSLLAVTTLTGALIVSQQLATTTDTTVYTVPANTSVKLAQGTLCNVTASAVQVSLSLVQSGGTIGDGTHRVINTYNLGGNDTLPLGDYINGHLLGDGDKIVVTASVAAAIDVVISGAVSA